MSSVESLKNTCQGRKKLASTVPTLFKKVSAVLTLWKVSQPNFVNDLPYTGCWNSAVKRWEHKLTSSTQVQMLDASFLRGFTVNVTKLHILSESVPSSTRKHCSLSYKFPKCTCNYYYHTVCVPEGPGTEASMNSTDMSFQKARSVCIYI